jgi:hypothetical protein
LGESLFHHDAVLQRAIGGKESTLMPFAARQGPISATGQFLLSASAGTALGSANLTWSLPTSGSTRCTVIDIQYRKNAGAWVATTAPNIAFAKTITGLDLASSYEFQIRGTNEMGVGAWSASAFVTTQAIPSLLDNLVLTANASFSLRKVRAAYAGSCLRVRRSSDNTETDIGFNSNGMLDTASLVAFVAGSSGFVKTWYDQSGANNATNATNAAQPRIVNAGVLETNNGLPCINNYDNGATAVYLESATGFPVAADVTIQAVVGTFNSAAINNVVGPAAGGNHSLQFTPPLSFFVGAGAVVTEGGGGVTGFNAVGASYVASTKTGRLFRGGAFLTSGNASAVATAGAGFQIGCYAGVDALQFDGKITEAMVFPTALNDTQMAAIGVANTAHWGA